MPTDYYAGQLIEGALVAGRYRLTRWLGLGAMGEVWSARDERLGRDVAVKLLRSGTGLDTATPERADRFVREAIAAARINHPNVVAVYDQGEYHRHLFLVMELVTGSSLDDLRLDGPMPVGSALAIATQICIALEAAHDAGVVHRDIKPANVMVTTDGRVKVLDFGIAGFMRETGDKLTRTNGIMGTPAYMAPEQVLGRQADARSDLYSLGCVLYALLTGAPPFDGDSSLDIMDCHVHQAPEPMGRRRFGIPPEIDQLVLWLLSKDPTHRPKSATVVSGRLEHLASSYARSTPPTAPRSTAGAVPPPGVGHTTMLDIPSGTPPRRRKWPARVAAACLVVGVLGSLLAVGRMTMQPAHPLANVGTGPTVGVTQHPAPKAGTSTGPDATTAPPTVAAPAASPVAPFLRYGAVAAGTGCVSPGPGQYECMVGRTGGAPVYQSGTLDVIGSAAPGGHTFYCQSSGTGDLGHGGFSNHWWAWTESDQGTWGWVNAVDIAGGNNDQPEPGLPDC